MSTKIPWTQEVWNPIRGCTKITPGCDNCYSIGAAFRNSGPGRPYEGLVTINEKGWQDWTGKLDLDLDKLAQPLRWKKPRMVFVNSMSDVFHESVPDSFLDLMWEVMSEAQGIFQICTKRSLRMTQYLKNKENLSNVWMGVSVENQNCADVRVQHLQEITEVGVKFISYEPALGPVVLDLKDIDWVIAGCETGPRARPANINWFRDVRDQCNISEVPFFLSQMKEAAKKSISSIGDIPLLDGQSHTGMPI